MATLGKRATIQSNNQKLLSQNILPSWRLKMVNSQTLQLAVQYHRANRLTEAEQYYRQVLKEQPQHPEALYGLGMLAQQVGQFPAAAELLTTAVSVQPELLKGWFSLGNLHQAQGKFSEAEAAYQKAIALKPDAAPIYNNLGYTLQQQGKWSEAIASYQKALEIEPNCTEADVNWGNALHAQGKLSPDKQLHYAKLNHELGVARERARDLKNAVAYYRQAINLKPDFGEAYCNLGVTLQQQGELEAAIGCYQRALEHNPNYGDVYLKLGKIYQDRNNLKEAISAYRQGLKLINPHYASAIEAYEGSETLTEVPTTPSIPQEEVIVGGHRFPAIPPVADDTGKRPFWSVVVTVYNRTDYLLECLASVLAQWQGEEQMEIIVIDDASKTPIFELVNSIGQGVISYYRNRQNLGLPGNWNAGVALTLGRWVHLLHDDDYILPGFYSRLQASLEGCSESIGAAFTGYQNINDKGEVIFSQQVYGNKRGIAENWLQRIGIGNSLNMPAVVIRREAHERLGLYHPELIYTSDWELYKRIAAVYDWWYEPEILARYRQHTNNVTSELMLSGKQMTTIRRAIEISENYLTSDLCAEITNKSRSHYFNYCLASATIPLKTNNLAGAWGMLEEALKIDRSSEAVAKLFSWLTREEATPLRDEIASRLISLPLSEPVVNA
jgi:tetratricopeptide (TPR) repeat protein/glycosyltransferase involved in cell wall biosynthesis